MNEFTYEVITNSVGAEIIKRVDIDGNETWVPIDPANSDYVAYLESLNDDTETE